MGGNTKEVRDGNASTSNKELLKQKTLGSGERQPVKPLAIPVKSNVTEPNATTATSTTNQSSAAASAPGGNNSNNSGLHGKIKGSTNQFIVRVSTTPTIPHLRNSSSTSALTTTTTNTIEQGMNAGINNAAGIGDDSTGASKASDQNREDLSSNRIFPESFISNNNDESASNRGIVNAEVIQ
jgi:hypothetical protein